MASDSAVVRAVASDTTSPHGRQTARKEPRSTSAPGMAFPHRGHSIRTLLTVSPPRAASSRLGVAAAGFFGYTEGGRDALAREKTPRARRCREENNRPR